EDEAVMVRVGGREDRVRRGRAVAEHAGQIDSPRALVDAAQRHAVPRVGVERAGAGAAPRIERVGRYVAGDGPTGLIADVGQAELVGAGQDVALSLGVGVEALQLQLLRG